MIMDVALEGRRCDVVDHLLLVEHGLVWVFDLEEVEHFLPAYMTRHKKFL